MRTTLLVAVLVVAVALIPPGAQAAPPSTTTGSYLFGNPVAYAAVDACAVPLWATNGIDSSCRAMPAYDVGDPYQLTISAAQGTIVNARVCFYKANGAFIACNPTGVPAQAAAFSVSSIGGAQITWTVNIF